MDILDDIDNDRICGVITYKGKCDYSLIVNPSIFSITSDGLIFYEVDKHIEKYIGWLLKGTKIYF